MCRNIFVQASGLFIVFFIMEVNMERAKLKLSGDFRKIIKLSWPVMVGMVLQSLLGTVDLKFISMIGKGESAIEQAAASLGASAFWVVFVISALVSSGALALVARSYGENDKKAIKKFTGVSIVLASIFGAVIGVICYINTEWIIKVMYNPDYKVLKLTKEYLEIIFLGTIFVFLNFTIRTILQALGDTKTPLYIFGFGNIVNLILDPILIFKLNYGIRGAAIATVVSNIAIFILITYMLIKKAYGESIKEFLIHLKLEIAIAIRILRIGFWACLQQVARPITGMLMYRLVSRVGYAEAIAAFGAGGQLFNYTFIFLSGLSVAVSIMVGQSFGRKDIDSADTVISDGLKLAIINMLIFMIPYFIFPKYIIMFFTKNPEVIKIGVLCLRIVYSGVIFVGFSTVYGGVFQGAGDTFPPMLSSVIANVVVKLPLAYILAIVFHMGTNGIWIAIALSVVVESAIMTVFFKRGSWKRKEI